VIEIDADATVLVPREDEADTGKSTLRLADTSSSLIVREQVVGIAPGEVATALVSRFLLTVYELPSQPARSISEWVLSIVHAHFCSPMQRAHVGTPPRKEERRRGLTIKWYVAG
jgi:hypothetical protein